MIKLIRQNLWFVIPFIIVWIAALVVQLTVSKAEIHMALNGYHTPFLDVFFKYYTEVGGWIPVAVAIIYFLFVKVKWGTLLSANLAVATLITSILKQLFRMPRPKLFFQELDIALPLVEGVKLHSTLSFPSGHTTACFALFFSLALFTKKSWLKFVCFIAACLGAYSRIYLSQHFLEDILAGSLISTITVVVVTSILIKYSFGNRSVIDYMSSKIDLRH